MAANPEPVQGVAPLPAAAPPPVTASSDQVTDLMIEQAKKVNPFASAWWMGLIQGILTVLLGILFWLEPSGFTAVLLQFVALFLVIVGLMDLMGGMAMAQRSTAASIAFWRGVIGFAGGLVLLSLLFLGYFSASGRVEMGTNLMGVVLLTYGTLGVVLAFVRENKRGRWTLVIISTVLAVLGLNLLLERVASITRVWVGPVLIVLGAGLIVYAFMRRSREKQALEKAA